MISDSENAQCLLGVSWAFPPGQLLVSICMTVRLFCLLDSGGAIFVSVEGVKSLGLHGEGRGPRKGGVEHLGDLQPKYFSAFFPRAVTGSPGLCRVNAFFSH